MDPVHTNWRYKLPSRGFFSARLKVKHHHRRDREAHLKSAMNKQQSQSRTSKQIGRKWWSLLIRRRHKRRGTATWRAHRQPSQKSQRWRPCLIKLAVRKIKRLTRRMAVFSWDINRQQLGYLVQLVTRKHKQSSPFAQFRWLIVQTKQNRS